MEEVLLYHAASETLICADFIENFSAGFSRQVDGHEALKFGMSLFLDTTAGRACCSPEHSIYATDLELFRGTVRKLAALPFRSLFVCHGDLILGDERDALTREGEATAATPETREAVVDVVNKFDAHASCALHATSRPSLISPFLSPALFRKAMTQRMK